MELCSHGETVVAVGSKVVLTAGELSLAARRLQLSDDC